MHQSLSGINEAMSQSSVMIVSRKLEFRVHRDKSFADALRIFDEGVGADA